MAKDKTLTVRISFTDVVTVSNNTPLTQSTTFQIITERTATALAQY